MERKRILIRTGNAILAAMMSLSPIGNSFMPVMIHAETISADTVTVENIGGDNVIWLEDLGEAQYFTLSATVTLNDYEEGQQSAALAFGDMRANVHGKIDWNNPVRLWGDSLINEAVCPGEKGQANTWLRDNGIDLSQPFTLTVNVLSDGTVSYFINGILACSSTLKEGYAGGQVGVMTFSSNATFSNITLIKEDVQEAVDRSQLESLVFECNALEEKDYEAESWQTFASVLAVAKEVLNNENATQEEVNQAAEDLSQAQANLKKAEQPAAVDKTELNEALKSAGTLKESDYTPESWEAFAKARDIADKASKNENATQEEVDAATKALSQAQANLKKAEQPAVVDKTELNEALKSAGTLKESDYTPESWEVFAKAIKQAQEIIVDENATQNDIDHALSELTNAKNALIKKVDDSSQKPIDPDSFNNIGSAGMNVVEGALVLDAAGDHFAMLGSQTKPAKDFRLEADVQLISGTGEGSEGNQMSAALVFGASNKKNPTGKWYGANVDSRRQGNADFFRVFGAGRDILSGGIVEDVDLNKPIHLAIDVKQDGSFVYSFGNTEGVQHDASGMIENWEGGYVGMLTFCAKAAFSNIQFIDRTVEEESKPIETDERWQNNLGDSIVQGGEWTMDKDGLASNAIGKGDTFLISEMEGENFIYETDLMYKNDTGAAGLLFRFQNTEYGKEGYAVNVDAGSHKAKFWRWEADQAQQLINEKDVAPAETYHLKVVCIDGSIQYWVNDVLIANLGDFTMQKDDLGQTTIITKGYYGLLNWNSDAIFQNTKFTVLDEKNTPEVADVVVGSNTGTVEAKAQFFPESPTWMQYVKNDAESVYIDVQANSGTDIVFEKDGKQYVLKEDIPVAEGANWITMTATNGNASRTYRINIHRFAPDNTYYNEPYRGQYHYSVKEGWANDPNGLVKYNGKYHMFYQFYDDNKWGPMHWMHATSTDLIHWNEEPVTFYPDMNGTMFSGCVAVDATNASGLFSTDKGGLIAYITVNGNGQRIKLAYSEDEGKTWKKSDKIAADWSNDSLQNRDFRDPKVFQWENKWFMVVAGGPLRIYSSDDMVNWKEESAYADLHTECPDLYPQEVEGEVKWILSRGGRYYKVGDLKEVDGKWTFVPDEYYKDKDGVMNFGRDSYAAMTYYESSFGTSANPTIPDIIELNWMNTWDDYCNQVGDALGQKYNGTFNLHLKVGLVKDGNGVYRLTQTPIEAYKELRKEETKQSGKVGADNDLLKDFQGISYEIVSRFMPEEGTKKIGFKVRTGTNGEETRILYDVEKNTLLLDRSKSGIQISNKFSEVNSQDLSDLVQTSHVTRNADGSIDLHVFVDASSVEVFANGYTAAGANQIFPLPTSRGASVVVEGEPCQVDLSVYSLDSIWEKGEAQKTIQSADDLEQTLYVGKSKTLKVYILPLETNQEIVWTSSQPNIAEVDEAGKVTAKNAGTATITATSKEDPELKLSFEVTVKEDNFATNIKDWHSDGNWIIENDELINDNQGYNAFRISDETYDGDYVVSTDVRYEKGLVNLFFASNASPFDNGAYSVQLREDNSLRLFRFAKDNVDEKTVSLAKPLNDNEYHHIEIAKKGNMVTVTVDGEEQLQYEYAQTDPHYTDAHVGLGLWDGKASFKNFMVTKVSDATVDTEALKQACEEAKNIVRETYTPQSLEALDKAYADAIAVLENQDATQEEVDHALSNLNKAIQRLQHKANKTELNKALKSAGTLKESDYTPESWEAFAKARDIADKASKNENATQEEVDAATKALSQAQANLKKAEQPATVDKTELNKALKSAGTLKESDYTPESWEAFVKARDIADKAS
ncbi:hypothetical protein C815_00022, partial [Firmicutes bacterium M10-2]